MLSAGRLACKASWSPTAGAAMTAWSMSATTSTFASKHRKEGSRFTDGEVHINGIESFWSYTKRRLTRFNGVKANFELHLKECEWRWGKDYDTILTELSSLLV